MANGQTIGSILGGILGTAVAPGVGTTIGASLGGAAGGAAGKAVGGQRNQSISEAGSPVGGQAGSIAGGTLGAAQLISGAVKKRQAEQLKPSLEDPEQRALLEEVAAKRQSIQTGAASATGIREAEQQGTTAQQNIARVTGGDVSGTVEALLKAQRGTQAATNRALAAGEQQQRFFTGLQADLTNRIAQRRLDLQQFQRVQALAEAAQARKEGISNLGAAFATAVPLGRQTPGITSAADPNRAQAPITPQAPTPTAGSIAPGPEVIGLNPGQSAFGGPFGI